MVMFDPKNNDFPYYESKAENFRKIAMSNTSIKVNTIYNTIVNHCENAAKLGQYNYCWATSVCSHETVDLVIEKLLIDKFIVTKEQDKSYIFVNVSW